VAYRVAYGTSDARGVFRAFDERSFATVEAAAKVMRAYKRRAYWTWVEDDRGSFVPVPGAKSERVRKGYPLRGLGRVDVTRNYVRKRQFSPKKCAAGSFRTIERGDTKIVVCCPKGEWDKRRQRCRVGTRAQSILKPR
jgi:hypothetical protein